MDAVVPHLDGRAEVRFWPQYLLTVLLNVHPYLCHLFVQLDYHRTKPSWQRVTTVACHLIHHVQLFWNPVNLKLLAHLFVVTSDGVLL